MVQQQIEINLSELDRERGANSTYKIRRNRALMTVLHFILTYPAWSISLFLDFASRTTEIPKPSEQISIPLQKLRNVVNQEARLYSACVNHSTANQHQTMERVVQLEDERVRVAQSLVTANLSLAANETDQCQLSTITAQRALKAFGDFPRKTCANPQALFVVLSQEVLQDDVASMFETYIDNSLEAFRVIADYAKKRTKYDYDYFIGVNGTIPVVKASLIDIPFVQLPLPDGIRVNLTDLLEPLLLGNLRAALNLQYNRLLDFNASIHGFMTHAFDLQTQLTLAILFIKGLAKPTLPNLPQGLNIEFEMKQLGKLMPPNFDIPDLPNIDALVGNFLEKLIALIQEILSEAAKEVAEMIEEAYEALKELLSHSFENYHPPQFQGFRDFEEVESAIDNETGRMQYIADTAKVDVDGALNEFAGFQDALVSSIDDSVPDEPNDFNDHEQDDFSFLDLGLPRLVIPLWLLTLIGFTKGQMLWIECITQAIRLYRLKRKYEKKGVPDLPEINYVEGDEEEEEESKQNAVTTKLQVAQLMLIKNMMNPWVIVGVMLIPMLVCVLVLWFPHVKTNCLHSRRGTFWARNILTPLQVNQANSLGYGLLRATQGECNRRQRTICSVKSAASDALYRSNKATLVGIENRLNESIEYQAIVDDCVDVGLLDTLFEKHCCGLKGYGWNCDEFQVPDMCPIDKSLDRPSSFRPVGELISDHACAQGKIHLEDSLFNCSVLEGVCRSDGCSGVDKDLIQAVTIEADCSVEVYFIHFAMFLATAVYHAIVINIFNALIFNGILHLRWRSLNPNGIKIISRVSDTGELMKGGDLAERVEKIEKTMKGFRISGWIQIGLGIAIFISWLLSFIIIKKAVAIFDAYPAQ